jgi:hypothetical protein
LTDLLNGCVPPLVRHDPGIADVVEASSNFQVLYGSLEPDSLKIRTPSQTRPKNIKTNPTMVTKLGNTEAIAGNG